MHGTRDEWSEANRLAQEDVTSNKVTLGADGWEDCRQRDVLVVGDTSKAISTALCLASGRGNRVWLAPRRSNLARLGRELSFLLEQAVDEGRIHLEPDAELHHVGEHNVVLALDRTDEDWISLPNDRLFLFTAS